MQRFKCEICQKEVFGSTAKHCHGQPMENMGEWELGNKQITEAPMIGRVSSYQYQCPITGKDINGKRDHEANLKQHGCRLLEPGERQDAERRKQQSHKEFDTQLDNGIGKIISEMPDHKKQALISEVTKTGQPL